MLYVSLVMLSCGLLVYLEAPKLLKAKGYKDLVVFLVMLLFSFALVVMQILGTTIPNPTKAIQYLVKQTINIRFDK